MITFRCVFISALAFIAVSNLSASERGFYVGAGLGLSSVDGIADTNSNVTLIPPDKVSVNGLPFDDEDFLWQYFAGYRVNRYVAIQAGYTNLGMFESVDLLSSDPAVLEIEELSLSAKFEYPLTKKISANWWLGVTRSSFNADGQVEFCCQVLNPLPPALVPGFPALSPVSPAAVPISDTSLTIISPSDETGYLWGFGFNWQFIPRVSLDLNYIKHSVQVINVETINLGLIVEL